MSVSRNYGFGKERNLRGCQAARNTALGKKGPNCQVFHWKNTIHHGEGKDVSGERGKRSYVSQRLTS